MEIFRDQMFSKKNIKIVNLFVYAFGIPKGWTDEQRINYNNNIVESLVHYTLELNALMILKTSTIQTPLSTQNCILTVILCSLFSLILLVL